MPFVATSRPRLSGKRFSLTRPARPILAPCFNVEGSCCDPGIHDHVPGLRYDKDRDHADRGMPVFLRMHGLRRAFAPQAGRLLRVLLLRVGALSADTGGRDTDLPSNLNTLGAAHEAGNKTRH